MKPLTQEETNKLLKLAMYALAEALDALNEEIKAVGDFDHPMIRRHQKIAGNGRRILVMLRAHRSNVAKGASQ